MEKCPYCASIVEKIDSCHFFKCHSNVCRENPKRCMCYLCEKGLQEKHHYSHYKNTWPYGQSCNSIEGIVDDSFDLEIN